MRAGHIAWRIEHSGPPASLSSVVRDMRIPHTKILGLFWLVFGGFWSVLLVWSLLTGAASITPRPQPGVRTPLYAWWEEIISNVLECSFFCASALLGIALLGRRRWTQFGLGIMGALLLAIWVLLIVSPSSPPMTIVQSIVLPEPVTRPGPILTRGYADSKLPGPPVRQIENLDRRWFSVRHLRRDWVSSVGIPQLTCCAMTHRISNEGSAADVGFGLSVSGAQRLGTADFVRWST